MDRYRLLETVAAVQYTGWAIPDVTCEGTDPQYAQHGCDSSRRYVHHAHTQAVGGMTVLQPGDWILPVPGGPFRVVPDAEFRSVVEVPEVVEAPAKAEK